MGQWSSASIENIWVSVGIKLKLIKTLLKANQVAGHAKKSVTLNARKSPSIMIAKSPKTFSSRINLSRTRALRTPYSPCCSIAKKKCRLAPFSAIYASSCAAWKIPRFAAMLWAICQSWRWSTTSLRATSRLACLSWAARRPRRHWQRARRFSMSSSRFLTLFNRRASSAIVATSRIKVNCTNWTDWKSGPSIMVRVDSSGWKRRNKWYRVALPRRAKRTKAATTSATISCQSSPVAASKSRSSSTGCARPWPSSK